MIAREPLLPYFYAIQPRDLCRNCGEDLTGKLRRDTLDGPECLAGCRPRVFQLALPSPGPDRIPASDLREPQTTKGELFNG